MFLTKKMHIALLLLGFTLLPAVHAMRACSSEPQTFEAGAFDHVQLRGLVWSAPDETVTYDDSSLCVVSENWYVVSYQYEWASDYAAGRVVFLTGTDTSNEIFLMDGEWGGGPSTSAPSTATQVLRLQPSCYYLVAAIEDAGIENTRLSSACLVVAPFDFLPVWFSVTLNSSLVVDAGVPRGVTLEDAVVQGTAPLTCDPECVAPVVDFRLDSIYTYGFQGQVFGHAGLSLAATTLQITCESDCVASRTVTSFFGANFTEEVLQAPHSGLYLVVGEGDVNTVLLEEGDECQERCIFLQEVGSGNILSVDATQAPTLPPETSAQVAVICVVIFAFLGAMLVILV